MPRLDKEKVLEAFFIFHYFFTSIILRLRQDEAFSRRLVATAASYISILYRGRFVRLQLTDGFAVVTPIDGERDQSQSLDGLDVLVSSVLESEESQHEIDTLKLGEDYNGSFHWCHLSALKNAYKMLIHALKCL